MVNGSIIFLDLARQTGFCEGVPGEKPTSGTVRLAPSGSEPKAVYAGMMEFLVPRLRAFKYGMVSFEAPFDPRHMKTNFNTARLLLGLPAIVEGVAHLTGHFNVREVRVDDVRKHLLGKRPAAGEAKKAVIARLRALGFDPADDNEADAIAGWLFVCAQVAPDRAPMTDPLFAGRSD